MTANTPQSRKARGRKFQQKIIQVLIEKLGINEDDIENRSSGAGGEDIILSSNARALFPFSVECKDQEKLNIWSALEQAESNAGQYMPIVCFKRNRTKSYVALSFDHFTDLIDAIPTDRRQLICGYLELEE